MFSMRDLSTLVKKSPQSLYSLIKQNKELSSIVEAHSTRTGSRVWYDEAVKDWLCAYYGVEAQESAQEAPRSASEPSQGQTHQPDQASAQATGGGIYEALTLTIETLRQQLEVKDAQISELTRLLDQQQRLHAGDQQQHLLTTPGASDTAADPSESQHAQTGSEAQTRPRILARIRAWIKGDTKN